MKKFREFYKEVNESVDANYDYQRIKDYLLYIAEDYRHD
jgi:hypothetical protein